MSTPYYAFDGNKIIAGPFVERKKARAFKKVGHCCDCCGGYSGGNTICYACIVKCFDPPKPEQLKGRQPEQLSIF